VLLHLRRNVPAAGTAKAAGRQTFLTRR